MNRLLAFICLQFLLSNAYAMPFPTAISPDQKSPTETCDQAVQGEPQLS